MVCASTKVNALSASAICDAAASFVVSSAGENGADEWRSMVVDAMFGSSVVLAIVALALRTTTTATTTTSIDSIRSTALRGVMAAVATDWLVGSHRVVASLSPSTAYLAPIYIDCFIECLLVAIHLVKKNKQ